jgi:hypothetical protein
MNMMDKLFIRIRRMPFVATIVLCVGLLTWSIDRTLHTAFLQQPNRVLVSPGSLTKSPPVAHAHEGWLAMRAFEHYMDSLRQDSNGRRRYDSILSARPGILDSARKAETFFYLHDH